MGEWIFCQITSNPYSDPRALKLIGADFSVGSLSRVSYIRPGKLFTTHASLILQQIGRLRTAKFSEIRNALGTLLNLGHT